SHGAFTWGVLDRLLEDERLEIEGISGTSAGAMNAGALLQGYLHGGRSGAREALDRFWHETSQLAGYNPIRTTIVDRLVGNWNIDREPAYLWADSLARLLSPYELNPANLNPLRDSVHSAIYVSGKPASRLCTCGYRCRRYPRLGFHQIVRRCDERTDRRAPCFQERRDHCRRVP